MLLLRVDNKGRGKFIESISDNFRTQKERRVIWPGPTKAEKEENDRQELVNSIE